MTRTLVICLILISAHPAQAHTASDSLLRLQPTGNAVEGQWDIALRDLDHAVGLDRDGDGNITWGELRQHHAAIARYALARLDVRSQGVPCALSARDHLVDHHGDGAYAVVRFVATCSTPPDALDIGYSLLFDLDPQHRGILRLGDSEQVLLFTATAREQHVALLAPGDPTSSFLRAGLQSSLQPQLLLMLGLLLLPAWRRRLHIAATTRIVAAFLLASSLTFPLSALYAWSSCDHLVSAGIVIVLIATGFAFVVPALAARMWMLAIAAGLLHGSHLATAFAGGSARTVTASNVLTFNTGGALGILLVVASAALLFESARSVVDLKRRPAKRGRIKRGGTGRDTWHVPPLWSPPLARGRGVNRAPSR